MPTPTPASLEEFKAHLNKSTTATGDDAELEMTLAAATEAVERWHDIGPIVTRDVTDEVVATDGGALLLPSAPVQSVTSVTAADGTVYGAADVVVRSAAGIATRTSGGFAAGVYTVAYRAGRGDVNEVPDALKMATLIIGKHIWDSQRGPRARLRAEDDESRAQWAGAGYLIPNRAAHLMQPYITVPVS